jgi:hypothetical protein
VALAPCLALYLVPHFGAPEDMGTYQYYRATWGGAPDEVYSHFLDLVLMTGNVVVLSTLVAIEELIQSASDTPPPKLQTWINVWRWTGWISSGSIGTFLDGMSGEGTAAIMYWPGFLPVLAATTWLLRRCVQEVHGRIPSVIGLCATCTIVHAGLQYVYEPSVTGAPSLWFVPLWLGSLALNFGRLVRLVLRYFQKRQS